jgi:hypothetical protein
MLQEKNVLLDFLQLDWALQAVPLSEQELAQSLAVNQVTQDQGLQSELSQGQH